MSESKAEWLERMTVTPEDRERGRNLSTDRYAFIPIGGGTFRVVPKSDGPPLGSIDDD